jgi:putative ABC transport system substrate-binding protein
VNAETATRDLEAAADALGQRLQRLQSTNSREINDAFATFDNDRPDALFVTGAPFFNSRRVQLVQLAAHYRIPTTYGSRAYPDIGGLMSYGTDVTDAYRQVGAYTGRILKGAKPADLPVVQASKFELIINNQTARMLGLTVPPSLLSIADEVIE